MQNCKYPQTLRCDDLVALICLGVVETVIQFRYLVKTKGQQHQSLPNWHLSQQLTENHKDSVANIKYFDTKSLFLDVLGDIPLGFKFGIFEIPLIQVAHGQAEVFDLNAEVDDFDEVGKLGPPTRIHTEEAILEALDLVNTDIAVEEGDRREPLIDFEELVVFVLNNNLFQKVATEQLTKFNELPFRVLCGFELAIDVNDLLNGHHIHQEERLQDRPTLAHSHFVQENTQIPASGGLPVGYVRPQGPILLGDDVLVDRLSKVVRLFARLDETELETCERFDVLDLLNQHNHEVVGQMKLLIKGFQSLEQCFVGAGLLADGRNGWVVHDIDFFFFGLYYSFDHIQYNYISLGDILFRKH